MKLGREVGLGPGEIVLDGDAAPQRKGAQLPLTCWPMSIVAKRLPISAAAEHLFHLVASIHTDKISLFICS